MSLSNPKRRAQYDATLPPEVQVDNKFIRHEVFYSRPSLVQIKEDQLLYILLEIDPSAKQSGSLPAPALNLCLVLDRSTSMQGDKMDILKATAIQLMRTLRPQDVLSMVSFRDRAEVVVPASINLDRRKQENSIQMMQPSGGTEIYQGLEAGMKEFRRTLDPSRVNHIILLTDGETYGDEQDCLLLAEEAARQNVGRSQKLSAMSQEADWKAFENPDYERQSLSFRRNVDALTKAARNKNLDGATLAYLRVTMSCVECHKYVRGRLGAGLI